MRREGMLLFLWCGLAAAQTFEVASVKRPQTGNGPVLSGNASVRIDDAQAELRNLTMSTLIQLAFRLPAEQISGPAWLQDVRWDIIAKLPAGASSKQAPEMLQKLLAERFRMEVHHEEKARPVFELVVGKGPLQLKESRTDPAVPEGCRGDPSHHTCHHMTMEQFALQLSLTARMKGMAGPGMIPWALDRAAVDKTGLTGTYDFSIDYGRVSGADGAPVDLPIAPP